MNLYEMLKARKVGWSNDFLTNIYAWAFTGGGEVTVHEYTGAVPYTFTANGEPLLDWYIKGNTVQGGNLVRDFYPAYDSVNGKYGMYETVNDTFYGSETDTPFEGGDLMPFRFAEGKLVHDLADSIIKMGRSTMPHYCLRLRYLKA